jgi:hypothetical protein
MITTLTLVLMSRHGLFHNLNLNANRSQLDSGTIDLRSSLSENRINPLILIIFTGPTG